MLTRTEHVKWTTPILYGKIRNRLKLNAKVVNLIKNRLIPTNAMVEKMNAG